MDEGSEQFLLLTQIVATLPLRETPALVDEAVEKLVEHDFIVLELH